MMSVALETRNVYEEFEVETDILFFKIGAQDLVSFHGKNYNIRKRMSAEQLAKLTSNIGFFQVQSDCFVNLKKISTIEHDYLYFGQKGTEAKSLPVSRRKQQALRALLPSLAL
jgi:DNA-binding LytR/AlgR family response regulator